MNFLFDKYVSDATITATAMDLDAVVVSGDMHVTRMEIGVTSYS